MMVDYKASDSDEIELSGTIPPGQTYLIVGRSTGRDTTKLPDGRIISAIESAVRCFSILMGSS